MNRAVPAGRGPARLALAALVLAGVGGMPACASDCAPAVRDGWIRPGPPGMPMRAGFGRIANDCDAPIEIIGVASPAFADVSLHETTTRDGISRMRAVEALSVPARGEAVLAPGGLHLMLSGPRGGLPPGTRVEVVFQLRDGGALRGAFEVR